MSVLIPEMKVFEYVQNGFVYAANNRTCDDLFASCIFHACQEKGMDQIFSEAKRWVKNLITLNCKSYAARYREKELCDLAPFYKERTHKVEALQLLKYLQCIEYNIEMQTIEKGYGFDTIKFEVTDQDRKDFALLQRFIADLKDSIIQQLPQYQNAKYSD